VLTNPVYAGVFVYGRRKREMQPGQIPTFKERRLALDEWDIVIPNPYPAYIAYEQLLSNRQQLRQNRYNFDKKGQGAARAYSGAIRPLIPT
jgi:hypothetical protein